MPAKDKQVALLLETRFHPLPLGPVHLFLLLKKVRRIVSGRELFFL
jgi:hypothetical protein